MSMTSRRWCRLPVLPRLWFAAHQAHGALVGQWMRSSVDYVVAVGPIYTVTVTLARAQADPGRGLSREARFHHAAHRRFRELLPAIPADVAFNSEEMNAEQIAAAIEATIGAS
jgi:hypothetical protein